MRKEQRGKEITIGILGNTWDKISTQIGLDIFLVVFLLLFGYFIIINLKYHHIIIQIMLIIALFFIATFFILIIFITGFERDVIYEKGVTNSTTTLLQKFLGQDFQPFDSVVAIKYGKTDYGNLGEVDFIALIDRDKGQIVRPFLNINYKTPFFQELISEIKKKCSDPKWIPAKYENLKRR